MEKISLITLINNPDIYNKNVLESTKKESTNNNIEYIQVQNSISGSSGLNEGIKKASNDLVLCCHQDIYFQENWYNQLIKHIDTLENHNNNNWGVCGFAGTTFKGKLVGTHSGLGMENLDSIQVQTLDCCTLLLRKSTMNKYNLKFDEHLLYYHMYGEDICLQSIDKGLSIYVLNVPITHNCKWTSGGGFQESTDYMRKKWKHKFSIIYTTVGNL